jgi:hypothetical protein
LKGEGEEEDEEENGVVILIQRWHCNDPIVSLLDAEVNPSNRCISFALPTHAVIGDQGVQGQIALRASQQG